MDLNPGCQMACPHGSHRLYPLDYRVIASPSWFNLTIQLAVPLKAVHSTSGPRIIFPHFLSVKRIWHIYIKKQLIIFQFLIFALLRAKIVFLPKLRLPTVIRKVKFTDFVKRATSPKMQLAKIRFLTNSKVYSLLWLTKYGNFSENSKPTREARRHPTLRPLFTY